MAKVTYPSDYNPIMEYWKKIESGDEVVCDKLFRTYRKIVYDMENHECERFLYGQELMKNA